MRGAVQAVSKSSSLHRGDALQYCTAKHYGLHEAQSDIAFLTTTLFAENRVHLADDLPLRDVQQQERRAHAISVLFEQVPREQEGYLVGSLINIHGIKPLWFGQRLRSKTNTPLRT